MVQKILQMVCGQMHHALSEGYGFILGLQFTKNSDGSPYDKPEVNALLETFCW